MSWTRFAAPSRFYQLAQSLVGLAYVVAAALAAWGLWLALAVAPMDAQQGQVYRIIYVHVPAAWMSMVIYMAMAMWSAVALVFRVRMAAILARALAPTGAMFTAIALLTGALWGQPTWGTWWVWDARLTSELLLLLLYLAYIIFAASIDDVERGDRAASVLAVVGAVNVPIIYFSVIWWNTLHQGATLRLSGPSRISGPMLEALVLMGLAAWSYAFAVVFKRAQALILEREADAAWVRKMLQATHA